MEYIWTSTFANFVLFCCCVQNTADWYFLWQSSCFDIPKLQLDTRKDYFFKKAAVKHNFLLREFCLIFRVNWISSVYVSSWRLGCDVTFKLSALFRFTISGQWLITKGIIQGLAQFLLTLLVGARNGKLHLLMFRNSLSAISALLISYCHYIQVKDES